MSQDLLVKSTTLKCYWSHLNTSSDFKDFQTEQNYKDWSEQLQLWNIKHLPIKTDLNPSSSYPKIWIDYLESNDPDYLLNYYCKKYHESKSKQQDFWKSMYFGYQNLWLK